MLKILRYHDDLDMQPLFEWDFKVLPYAINWFQRALDCPGGLDPGVILRKKLSVIYQFIRGMPSEYIEARLMQELKEITTRKKRLRSDLEGLDKRERHIMRNYVRR